MTAPPAPDAPGADAAPRRRRRRLWPKILIAVAGLLVLTIGAGVVYGVALDRRVRANLSRGPNLLPSTNPTATTSTRPAKEAQETGTLNYVLLGSDSRDPEDEGDGRSDTIMVVHLTKKRDKAYVISFPRDMYVNIPGHGKSKINSAFEIGGSPLTVETLEDLTKTRMDHVVLVDFEGFVELTEDLGGVTVTNKTAFQSHGYTYPKGKITIKGKEALWFVRERHALPGGDLDRAENQRKVIKAVVVEGAERQGGLRPDEVHRLHRRAGQAPDRGRHAQRQRDPYDGPLAAPDRQGHRADAGTAQRLRHRQPAERGRGGHRQDGASWLPPSSATRSGTT